ncbi:MAG: hypothetical protein COA94_02185, partial [Rickettsiales bacterium]
LYIYNSMYFRASLLFYLGLVFSGSSSWLVFGFSVTSLNLGFFKFSRFPAKSKFPLIFSLQAFFWLCAVFSTSCLGHY